MQDSIKQFIETIVPTMHGWCTPAKAYAMVDLIMRTSPRTVVEIGVFGGRSLIPQAMALRINSSGCSYGIDPWRIEPAVEGNLSEADKKWWSEVDLNDIHRSCMDTIWNLKLEEYCVIIRAASQHCPQLFGGGIDILHIDGTHSEEVSVRDVKFYLPQVGRGKYIWFDDTDWTTTGKAVAMLESACERIDNVGTCVLFKRK